MSACGGLQMILLLLQDPSVSRLKERSSAPSPQPVHMTSAPPPSVQGNTHVSNHILMKASSLNVQLKCSGKPHKQHTNSQLFAVKTVGCALCVPGTALLPVSLATANPQPMMPGVVHAFQVGNSLLLCNFISQSLQDFTRTLHGLK